MIANSSNCLISLGLLASIAEGDSVINATLLYFTVQFKSYVVFGVNGKLGIFIQKVGLLHILLLSD